MNGRKYRVLRLQSGHDALGADQAILGTEDGTGVMAVPNGTVVYDTEKSDSDWRRVRLMSDLEMEDVYAVHEEEGEVWWVDPDDVKKEWVVSEEVFYGKIVPAHKDVLPEEQSAATVAALEAGRQAAEKRMAVEDARMREERLERAARSKEGAET
jgi:hypothetical protein